MDFLMPDDATAQKMCEEYASCLKNKAHSLAYINEPPLDETEQNSSQKETDVAEKTANGIEQQPLHPHISLACDIKVLFLYIIVILGYNARYGTQIYDADGGVGGLRRMQSAFGSLNHLVSDNG